MASLRVKGVVCLDTSRDISGLLNAAADEHGFDAVGFVAGAIAESGLKEHAARERAWPDVSFGLWQPAVKWLGPEATGLTRAGDGTAIDTPYNCLRARAYCWDAAWLTAYVAPRYVALLKRWGEEIEAWCRWNKPNLEGSANPNRANYIRSYEEAERYREPMATVEEDVQQLKAQQALQTLALRKILEGELKGADGAAGTVVALEGGQSEIEVSPTWGKA